MQQRLECLQNSRQTKIEEEITRGKSEVHHQSEQLCQLQEALRSVQDELAKKQQEVQGQQVLLERMHMAMQEQQSLALRGAACGVMKEKECIDAVEAQNRKFREEKEQSELQVELWTRKRVRFEFATLHDK